MTPVRVVGIETTCDETAVAVIVKDDNIKKDSIKESSIKESGIKESGASQRDGWCQLSDNMVVLAHNVYSQVALHQPYGGIMPRVAARAHLQILPDLVVQTLDEAGVELGSEDIITVCRGPGLIGGLMVGMTLAKSLCYTRGCRFYAINHLEAHALSPRAFADVSWPYLLLLVSGGHTQLVGVMAPGDYHIFGKTRDDAAGEMFDKIGRLLGLPYPGGPHIERLAASADGHRPPLPRPMINSKGVDFSFSGLKTEVSRLARRDPPNSEDKARIAAAVQDSVSDVLVDRMEKVWPMFLAMARARGKEPSSQVVAAGGVLANGIIRERLWQWAHRRALTLTVPPPQYCTDNAVTVAWSGWERYRAQYPFSHLDTTTQARLPLNHSDHRN